MRILLDTSAFIWSLDEREKLNDDAQQILRAGDQEIFLSAVSSWEIVIKWSMGKLKLPKHPAELIPEALTRFPAQPLAVTHNHSLAVSELARHHNDPFDRMLIAQARSEKLVLMTADPVFEKYSVETFWCGK
jgi:PIN domain nuclease of toxin-antitoxin system